MERTEITDLKNEATKPTKLTEKSSARQTLVALTRERVEGRSWIHE
jgi:hypothetical protein